MTRDPAPEAKPVPDVTELTRPYWEAATRDELHVQLCPRCEKHFLYPTRWCPHCWFPDPVWTVVTGKGQVVACTAVHQAPLAAYRPEAPYCLAIVRLDEGPQLMSNVVGCAASYVRIGMEVTVEFEPRGDVKVPVFRPTAVPG